MTVLLAIDPGPTESAYVFYEPETKEPTRWGKGENHGVLGVVRQNDARFCAIEMVASYGMAVGAEVFETCVWVGRFMQEWAPDPEWDEPRLIYRREVKLHLCGDLRAKDANIRQAIIDRYGGKERAIGRKATPGPLYGMTSDCWAALGVAITATETEMATFAEPANIEQALGQAASRGQSVSRGGS
jgi:hypothetical protein